MPAKPKRSDVLPFSDPNKEPVRIVDQVVFRRRAAANLDLTCLAEIMSSGANGEFITEKIVSARLRIDLGMARQLIDGLIQQIAMAEAVQSAVN